MVSIEFEERLLVSPLPTHLPVERTKRTIIMQVPAGKSVNQTLMDLNIELSQAVVALVNGKTTDLEEPLVAGDQVRLLPQIAGGD
jgi:molybdopterin converting factor small subunit